MTARQGRIRFHAILALLLNPLFAAHALAQSGPAAVDVQIKSVGARIESNTTNGVRLGQWVPVLVELTLQQGQVFQGDVRVECTDIDGDFVDYVERPVALAPGPPKRVWVYARMNSAQDRPRVTVTDEQGARVAARPLPDFDVVSNSRVLIADISDRPVTSLRLMRSSSEGEYGMARPYYRDVMIAQQPAVELPDRWFGLEMFDAIVWDEPDPDKLSSAQLDALRDWVRFGGQLIIGVGASWQKLRKSPLAEILPLEGDGATVTARALPRFAERVAESPRAEFEVPIALTTARRSRGWQTLYERIPGGPEISLVVMDSVGSGRVVTTAGLLRDLSKIAAGDRFLREILDLNPISQDLIKSEAEQMYVVAQEPSLYEWWIERIDYRGEGSFYNLAATAFVVAYILIATLASWWWLRRHTLTHLSWTVFAGFALVASAVSIVTVTAASGLSRGVKSLALVDLESGKSDGRGHFWFGYRSPIRQTPDLSLPGEDAYLRALSHGRLDWLSYATPQRYGSVVSRATLEDTPMRATLKQFEGAWSGPLPGAIRAQLTVDRDGRVTSGSWIKNDLGVRILGGYLLYLDPRLRDDPLRPAGLKNDYRLRANVPPAINVLALELPGIAPGDQVRDPGARAYQQLDQALADYRAQASPDPAAMPDLQNLWRLQQDWSGNAAGLFTALARDTTRRTIDAALLLSTRNLYLHCTLNDFSKAGRRIRTEGLTDVDVTHWLMRGQGILLLVSDEPGPARLHANGEPMRIQEGLTLYRVRTPLEYSRAGGGADQ